MTNGQEQGHRSARNGLSALARDARGNVLALMAAGMFPLAGMVGGAVDLSRMYIVKTKLQHACDAGALAGRKAMGAGVWTQANGMPNATAERFFAANIGQNPYGANGLEHEFNESAGRVTGTASADVPMTLMRIFGFEERTITVSCDAEMRLPNTDVMFVLDVTGSMGSKATSSDSETKMVALRRAVKCFYEIVARLDTDATCDGGAPSGGTGDQVQIRFGFVPYNTNVNVGRLLPTAYLADRWSYQSREPRYASRQEWQLQSSSTNPRQNVSYPNVRSSDCTQANATALNTSNTQTNGNERTVTETRYTRTGWTSSTSHAGTCQGYSETTTSRYQYVTVTEFSQWRYDLIEHPVAGLKNGPTAWNGSIELPLGSNGTNRTVAWDGCIEERQTVTGTNFTPIPDDAIDLDIDRVPDNAASRWGPLLRSAIYTRYSGGNYTRNRVETASDLDNNSSYSCPTESRKMAPWTDAGGFSSYVNSLTPNGNTYHDIGLLWGARLLSPTGLFASENAVTPQGGEIERHLIFMTDGDTVTHNFGYSAYGVPWYDRRNVASPGTANNGSFNNEVNARFDAICSAVKNQNVTLWVISFGNGSNATTEGRLEDCATPGRYFTARSSSALQATFRQIADQISALRLTN
ncbi:TadE/TadG family type IV pilus assembly protein [Sphingomonas sp. AX6]|uniref:TadE/TadG family type IV pilus assembly protein n=1 Tax=Sphingomonas sp. AX6 TaxID=2653171 RepID=UPI00135B624D|nr:TadE/TadG family type IV pilus assembly protein [Sphingomonas sp. AX6]